MLVVAVLFAFGAVAVGVRGYMYRVDGMGRQRELPLIRISVLLTAAAAFATPTILRHHEESKLDKVATVLVGSSATVHCETLGQSFVDLSGDLGFVKFGPDGVPEHHTTIMRAPCADLKRYYDGDWAHPSRDEIIAVHVLTHESMHMRGEPVEWRAECEAMQRDAETAQLLGATPQEGLELARAYWLQDYPDMPDAYTSEDCKPGGELDEGLPDPPWTRGDYVAVKLPAAG